MEFQKPELFPALLEDFLPLAVRGKTPAERMKRFRDFLRHRAGQFYYLHRAHVIVNYDTPWNSTRLMQRIGRVNRIGSTAAAIHIFNFYPTAQVDSDIDLHRKAFLKL